MPHRSRLALTTVVLVLWILTGPLAAAFGACAAMGAMCEGPCGVAAYAPALSTTAQILPVTAWLGVSGAANPAVVVAGVLEPPPKSSLLSA